MTALTYSYFRAVFIFVMTAHHVLYVTVRLQLESGVERQLINIARLL